MTLAFSYHPSIHLQFINPILKKRCTATIIASYQDEGYRWTTDVYIVALHNRRGYNLSKLGQTKYVRPYQLRKLEIMHTNQVWAIDITYIPWLTGSCTLLLLSTSTVGLWWAGTFTIPWRQRSEKSDSTLGGQEETF